MLKAQWKTTNMTNETKSPQRQRIEDLVARALCEGLDESDRTHNRAVTRALEDGYLLGLNVQGVENQREILLGSAQLNEHGQWVGQRYKRVPYSELSRRAKETSQQVKAMRKEFDYIKQRCDESLVSNIALHYNAVFLSFEEAYQTVHQHLESIKPSEEGK